MGKVTSVITTDMKHCCECGSNYIEVHHCIHGTSNRKWADRYHLVVPLCHYHHMMLHNSSEMDMKYKVKAQKAFEQAYPNLSFREIFGKNYI